MVGLKPALPQRQGRSGNLSALAFSRVTKKRMAFMKIFFIKPTTDIKAMIPREGGDDEGVEFGANLF